MKLGTYLEQRKMLPTQFAAQLAVPASTITRLINGDRLPGIELAATIKKATGGKVSFEDFLPKNAEPKNGARRAG